MTNLTISLDESIIRSARVRAIGEGTSVSAKLREFLAQYAQDHDAQRRQVQRQAGAAIVEMARATQFKLASSAEPKAGETPSRRGKFSRDEMNDRYPTWPPRHNKTAG